MLFIWSLALATSNSQWSCSCVNVLKGHGFLCHSDEFHGESEVKAGSVTVIMWNMQSFTEHLFALKLR